MLLPTKVEWLQGRAGALSPEQVEEARLKAPRFHDMDVMITKGFQVLRGGGTDSKAPLLPLAR